MNANYFVLDSAGNPVEESDSLAWGLWFEKAERHVDRTEIGDVLVSTVFLGLNHNWGDGPPILYETMVFGGELDGEMRRYCTKDEASAGHQEVIALVKESGEIA